MVNIRLDALPQDQPCSIVGWRMVCKQCGAAGTVNITPNWYDRRQVGFHRFKPRGAILKRLKENAPPEGSVRTGLPRRERSQILAADLRSGAVNLLTCSCRRTLSSSQRPTRG